MSLELLERLEASLEAFLDNWTENMREAGYLAHTTAKRDDCVAAFRDVLGAVRRAAGDSGVPAFGDLLGGARHEAAFLLATAKNHRLRGVTAEMFFGCFKTLIHSLEQIAAAADLPAESKWRGLLVLRRVCDLLETALVGDWAAMSSDEELQHLKTVQRRLTLEKNRYENIYAATSDPVFIADGEGRIVEGNPAAQRYFADLEWAGRPYWDVLGLPGDRPGQGLRASPLGEPCEISPPGVRCTFTVKVIPLQRVSLASAGFVVVLNDVTALVDSRRRLEDRVVERTAALTSSERVLRALFQSVGSGVLLLDEQMTVVRGNRRAGEMYGLPVQRLVGTSIRTLTDERGWETLAAWTAQPSPDGRELCAEMIGVCADGTRFPVEVTLSKIDVEGTVFWPVIARDISEQKALEEHLRREKTQTEEMNVTLRNVLQNIDRDRKEFERGIARKIQSQLLPAMEKVRREPDPSVRSIYLDLLQEQLVALTKGFEAELDACMLKLSKTEMEVCRFIRAGATSKEIGEAMNLSFETVQTHRKNIRKKLGLTGRDVNLHSYLASRRRSLSGSASA